MGTMRSADKAVPPRRGGLSRRLQRMGLYAAASLSILISSLPAMAERSPDQSFDGVACVQGVETFLKVRDGAAADARIVGRLRAEACGFTVLHACRSDEWCRVYLPEELNGWAHGRYLRAWDPSGLDRRDGSRRAAGTAALSSVKPGAYAYRHADFAAELVVTDRVSVLSLVGRNSVEGCPGLLFGQGVCGAIEREGEMVLRLPAAAGLGEPERPGGSALMLTNLAISVEPEGTDATMVLHDTGSGTTETITLRRDR